jgi:hypothetical protein
MAAHFQPEIMPGSQDWQIDTADPIAFWGKQMSKDRYGIKSITVRALIIGFYRPGSIEKNRAITGSNRPVDLRRFVQ